ncbi:zinc finger protein 782-like [Sabethes cyaneus]|uniref:zinc finger protein 782-like n=1 Tax=Sabethes cyaneus TaxID=53552 RepID=UPI00237ECA12|nr:zinc finger protein 782-like [Sabethes cyaneus]
MTASSLKTSNIDDTTEETERIKCWICPAKYFDNEQSYQDHTEKIHQGYQFRCEECEEEVLFKDLHEARQHVDDKHDINTEQCPECGESFNEFNLRKHLLLVHQQTRQYKCALCENQEFAEREDYESHIHNQHQGYRCKCTICHRLLKGKLRTHIEYIHSEGTARCNICNKEYSNKYKLMRHLKCHTDPRDPGAVVRCERCNETFESVSKLNYHKTKHQTKIYQCDKCSKMFYRNGALVQHQKSHEGEQELSCDRCNKCFTTSNGLRKHLTFHEKMPIV